MLDGAGVDRELVVLEVRCARSCAGVGRSGERATQRRGRVPGLAADDAAEVALIGEAEIGGQLDIKRRGDHLGQKRTTDERLADGFGRSTSRQHQRPRAPRNRRGSAYHRREGWVWPGVARASAPEMAVAGPSD
jgi:hypothetical protein